MMTATDPTTDVPVRKTVTVKASPERAFRIFTSELDSWWPRTHHIGKVPMKKAIIEGKPGGRCYTEQMEGSECDWGKVTVWEPPRRLVIAWQITHAWGYEPDLAKASEVEVRFSPDGSGGTRVDLEHRHFSRHGAGGASMRTAVDSEGGWGTLLKLYAERAEKAIEER
jgi:uncharacterized protein YndB with AHSA1/START domain